MAKYENEGYCPSAWVPKTWNENSDKRLIGLWSLVGDSIVYVEEHEHHCTPDSAACNQAFGTDAIAYDLLAAIVRKNVNEKKIAVYQLHSESDNKQALSDIHKIMKRSTSPELVLHPASNFAAVLADTTYGMDVWIWDLRITK